MYSVTGLYNLCHVMLRIQSDRKMRSCKVSDINKMLHGVHDMPIEVESWID